MCVNMMNILIMEKYTCKKDEYDVNGKINEHAQWCQVRMEIMGKGSGYYMLPGK